MHHSNISPHNRHQPESPEDDPSYPETEKLAPKQAHPTNQRNPIKSNGNISNKRGAVSFNIGRIMPRNFTQDKEFLYEENIKLKQSVQEFREEVLKLRTRLSVTEREKDRIAGEFSHSDLMIKNASSRVGKRNSNMMSYSSLQNQNYMKKMLRQSRDEITILKNQNAKLKKTVKYTQINQLQIQNKYLLEECSRLGSIIESKVLDQNQYIDQYERKIRELKDELQGQRENLRNVVNGGKKRVEEIQGLKAEIRELEFREKKLKKQLADTKRGSAHNPPQHRKPSNTSNKNPKNFSIHTASQQQQQSKPSKPAVSNKRTSNTSLKNNQATERKNLNKSEQGNKSSIVKVDTSNGGNKNGRAVDESAGKEREEKQKEKEKEKEEEKEIEIEKGDREEEDDGYGDQFEDNKEEEDDYGENFDNESEPKQSPKKDKTDKQKEKQQYQDQFDQVEDDKSQKQQVLFTKSPQKPSQSPQQILKQTITFRLMSQRYSYKDLVQDIKQSKMSEFTLQQLASMLNDEPFFLSQEQIQNILSDIFGRDDLHLDDQVKAKEFVKKIKAYIGDFQSLEEEREQEVMQECVEFVEKNSKKLKKKFDQHQNNHTVTKDIFISVLKQHKLSQAHLNILLGQAALVSTTLNQINYSALIKKLIN